MSRSRVYRGGERVWVVSGPDGSTSYVDSLSGTRAVLVVDLSRRTGAAPSVHAWVECDVGQPARDVVEVQRVRVTYAAGHPTFTAGGAPAHPGPWYAAQFDESGALFLLTTSRPGGKLSE